MGRKTRKRMLPHTKLGLPTRFLCPHCGRDSLKITILRDKKKKAPTTAMVECPCGQFQPMNFDNVRKIDDKVDIYGRVMDKVEKDYTLQ